jgi:regulator of nonsense transcripts 3
VKILKKSRTEAAEAARHIASQVSAESSSEAPSKPQSQSLAPEAPPKSRRAGIAAAARLLQKDLGLSPGSAHRRARLDAAKAEAEAKASGNKDKEVATGSGETSVSAAPAGSTSDSTIPPAAPTKSQPPARSRGGRGAKETSKGKDKETQPAETAGPGSSTSQTNPKKKVHKEPSTPKECHSQPSDGKTSAAPSVTKGAPAKNQSAGTSSKKPAAAPAVKPGAVRAFVKHANPSQGVTEQLLKQALEEFGIVTFVEIDKRKGFAYVDFSDHESLVKAMAASPVPVAQGTVQVLERKDKKPAPAPAAAASSSSSVPQSPSAPSSSSPANPAQSNPAPSGSALGDKTAAAQGNNNRRGRRGGGGGKAAGPSAGKDQGGSATAASS